MKVFDKHSYPSDSQEMKYNQSMESLRAEDFTPAYRLRYGMHYALHSTGYKRKRGKMMRSCILALCYAIALPAVTAAQTPNKPPSSLPTFGSPQVAAKPVASEAQRKVGDRKTTTQGTIAPSKPRPKGQVPSQRPTSTSPPATPANALTTPPTAQPEGVPVLSGQGVPVLGGQAIPLLEAPVTGAQVVLSGYGGGPVNVAPATGLPTLSLPSLSLPVLSFSGATTPGFVPIEGGLLMLPPAGTTLPVSRVIPTLVPEEGAAPAGIEQPATERAEAGRPATANGNAGRLMETEPFVNILGGTPIAILETPLTGPAAFRPYTPAESPAPTRDSASAGSLAHLGLAPLSLPALNLPSLAFGTETPSAIQTAPAALATTQHGVTLPLSTIVSPSTGMGTPAPIPASRTSYSLASPLPGLRAPTGFGIPSLSSPRGLGMPGGLRLPTFTSPFGFRGLNLPGLGGLRQLVR
jgi:hypothetical protein